MVLIFLSIFFFMSAIGAFLSDSTMAGFGQLALVVFLVLFMRWSRRRQAQRQMMQYAYQPREYKRHTRSWWRR